MKTETISFLVQLLETGLESQEKPAATKAQIVKALKAMLSSLRYGEQVNSLRYKTLGEIFLYINNNRFQPLR